MAKPKCWQWDHFQGGEMQNKAFKKAYCNYCLKIQMKEIMATDELAFREGRLAELRGQEKLFAEGK